MSDLKEMKYLLLDLDGCVYGKHNNYPLEKVFGQVSKRMTKFISERLKINLSAAKELQKNYFYKYNTSLNGLMIHHDIPPEEFLIQRTAKSIEDANFVAHKVLKTRSELIEMGYDKDIVEIVIAVGGG